QLGRSQFRLDLMLHSAQLAQGIEIEKASIDEASELRDQLLAECNRACHGSRAQQRRALPGLTVVLIEAERALERDHQWRAAAPGPQPQIDPKRAVGEHFGK